MSLPRLHLLGALLTLSLAFPLNRLAAAPPAQEPAAAPPGPFWSVVFSPDGRTLAGGSYKRVVLWDIGTGGVQRVLGGCSGPVRSVAFSPDGKRLAAGSGKPGALGEARVWDLASMGDKPAVLLKGHEDTVESVAFAGPNVLLTASVDEKALVTDLQTQKVLATLGDHTNRVVAVAVSPGNQYIATGSLDRTVKIWSGSDYKPVANLEANAGPVTAVAFVQGEQIAVAGEEGNVRIYRMRESRTGSIRGINFNLSRSIDGNRTPLFALGVAGRGNFLACGGADKTVGLFDVTNGSRRHLLKESPDEIYGIAFSPDGALVAAASRDGKVRVWNTSDGKLTAALPQ